MSIIKKSENSFRKRISILVGMSLLSQTCKNKLRAVPGVLKRERPALLKNNFLKIMF